MVRIEACRPLLAAALVAVAATSCGGRQSAFCKVLSRGAHGFDDNASTDDHVHAIDAIVAQLAPADRADLVAVRTLLDFGAHPDRYPAGSSVGIEARYRIAVGDLDRRLKHECGTPLDAPPALFVDLRPPATTAAPSTSTTSRPTTTGGAP